MLLHRARALALCVLVRLSPSDCILQSQRGLYSPLQKDIQRVGSTEEELRGANPAGCVLPKRGWPADFDREGGAYPAEEFREMLATRRSKVSYYDQEHYYVEHTVPWCPEPLDGSPFVSEDAELFAYLRAQLQGLEASEPLVVSAVEIQDSESVQETVDRWSDNAHKRVESRARQVFNYVCGLQRVGVLHRAVMLAVTEYTADALRKDFPGLRVLWHPGFQNMLSRIGGRTGISIGNRVAKLVIAGMLLDIGREFIVSDVDTFWRQDPSEYLRGFGDGKLDLVAMKDLCWLEINSGFLYYRPTERAKELIRIALGTVKYSEDVNGRTVKIKADNDQYLLNCALARSAARGLNYRVLPHDKFWFGPRHRHAEKPLVWHLGGFSANKGEDVTIDRITAMEAIDVDLNTSRCLKGSRLPAKD